MSETITQTITRITALIQEKAPNVDTSPGSVFSELIIGLESQIQNQVYSDINNISSGSSISAALASTVPTYNPVIDNIASNYNVIRGQGAYSNGTIKINVSNLKNYYLPSGFTFTQPNLNIQYATIAPVNISTSASPSQIYADSGSYAFTIDVQCTIIGQQPTITNGTLFTISSLTQLPEFLSASAVGTFETGLDVESDQELITRFQQGLSVKNLLTTSGIVSKLTSTYPSFQEASLADLTSPINLRSISNPLNIKIPGCVDVYVKDGYTIPVITFQVTPDTRSEDNTAWVITNSETQAPGFYRVLSVQNAANTNVAYLPFTVTYGFDSSASSNLPDSASARYSIYQTATIKVTDTNIGTPPVYNVTVLASPDLTSMQSVFLDSDNRIPGADYLVKGMVPCIVSLSLTVNSPATGNVDIVGLQEDIFSYINNLPASQPIAVSQIINLCHKHNAANVALPITLSGKILAPYSDATTDVVTDNDIIISATDFLAIPELPQYGVTSSNTMFYISYFDNSGNQNINIKVN